jgi:hypothetical protein
MAVTIDNRVPDPIRREDINGQIQEVFEAAPQGWQVSIIPAQNNDDWQLQVYSPSKREFSTNLSGPDGQHNPAFIRQYIEGALRESERHQSAAATPTAAGAILQKSVSTARDRILQKFALLSGNSGGIESWLTANTEEQVFVRLGRIESEPLSKVQLNQLLLLGHEAGVSDGFFQYYWLSAPRHVYDVTSVPGFKSDWLAGNFIQSLDHLFWGLYRLYVDALLFFGTIRIGYRFLRFRTKADLETFFGSKRMDTEAVKSRGPALPLVHIPRDDRYLVAEQACKSYAAPRNSDDLKTVLLSSLRDHLSRGGGSVSIRVLLDGTYVKRQYPDLQKQFIFSADDILRDEVSSIHELEAKYSSVLKKFIAARDAALQNTKFYLSMVNDLDVYVATSMRSREHFRWMADTCEAIFSDPKLKDLKLRYFNPTLSAAEGHEDKGLIECLMVKCAKALVYIVGEYESYGKDAEAAMALSLGKPVIFNCDASGKAKFYRDVHPLSRLIEFDSGVAVGALVASTTAEVSELLYRLFENRMEYELEHPKPGYFRLKEKMTGSVVRVQTGDVLLRETFWNYYHNRPA